MRTHTLALAPPSLCVGTTVCTVDQLRLMKVLRGEGICALRGTLAAERMLMRAGPTHQRSHNQHGIQKQAAACTRERGRCVLRILAKTESGQ